MRQFNYFYSSYIKNKHGFLTFIPHANIFHPYFGFAEIGYNGNLTPYLKLLNLFNENKLSFIQKVKVFFPQIREGVVYIDKIKYGIDSNPIDEVKVEYKVIKNSDYLDYVPITNHIAEFEVEIIVDSKYSGLWYPASISCDYIDLLLHQERISLTEIQSDIKLIPYFGAHHTDSPLLYINSGADTIDHMRNNSLTYQVMIPSESAEFLRKYNYKPTEYLSRMSLDNPGAKFSMITIEAFITNYAIEDGAENYSDCPNIYKKEDEVLKSDFLPMLNDTWFTDTLTTCKAKATSFWYTTIYDMNWKDYDLPNCMCPDDEHPYTADQTRGYVWYKVIHNYKETDATLTSMALSQVPKVLVKAYREYYIKEKD